MYEKLKDILSKWHHLLLWTPASFLVPGHISSLALFNKFQRNEIYFQLKVLLVGIIGFTAIFGISSQAINVRHALPWNKTTSNYAIAIAVVHVLLVVIALLYRYLQRLVIFRNPWTLTIISYVILNPLIINLTFTKGMINSRLYIITSILLLFVATLYYQQSFIVSAILWITILIVRIAYLFNNSSAAEVSQK